MSRKKMLWLGDSPTIETGFGRVTEQMLNGLKDKFDVSVFGVNYYNEQHEFPYDIYPASGENLEKLKTGPYGDAEELTKVFNKVKPDIVVANNDTWVVNKYAVALEPWISSGSISFLGYVPIDGGPYHRSLVANTHSWTGIATYTKFGRSVLEDAGLSHDIAVIPHGTNTTDFYPMEQRYARKLLNLKEDVFYFFNGNRNQPRKRYDIMVKAFALFLSRIPDDAPVSLFVHGGLVSGSGWNVPALLERECEYFGVKHNGRPVSLLTQHTNKPYPKNMVSKSTLNRIYNAMDVGLNTCHGEGWGLVNTEHAAVGVPQIVPDHSSLGELFDYDRGALVNIDHWDTERPYLIERGVPSIEDVAAKMELLYKEPQKRKYYGENGMEYFRSDELSWNNAVNIMVKWVSSFI